MLEIDRWFITDRHYQLKKSFISVGFFKFAMIHDRYTTVR